MTDPYNFFQCVATFPPVTLNICTQSLSPIMVHYAGYCRQPQQNNPSLIKLEGLDLLMLRSVKLTKSLRGYFHTIRKLIALDLSSESPQYPKPYSTRFIFSPTCQFPIQSRPQIHPCKDLCSFTSLIIKSLRPSNLFPLKQDPLADKEICIRKYERNICFSKYCNRIHYYDQ